MNIKPFLHGLSWLVVLNVLVKPLWVFGIDRKVQLLAGHEAYGTYFSVLNLSIILSIIADAGLTNMLNRQLALRAQLPVGRIMRVKAVLSLLYLIVLLFISWLSHVRYWELVWLTGLLQVASSWLVFFRNMVTGYQLFRSDAWLSVADKSATILICAGLLYIPFSPWLSLSTFLWIQIGTTGAAALAAAWIAFRHHESVAGEWQLGEVFRHSLPFVLLILLMSVHTRLDAFLLERLHPRGAFEAGLYAAAYRLLDAGNTVGYMTASFLVPFAARHLQQKELIDRMVLRLRHLLLTAAVGFAALCFVFAPQLMRLLYHLDGAYPARVLALCVAVLPAYYIIHLYGSLLTASGRLAYFSGVVLTCVLLNTALNLLLIPRLGASACCIAALVSQYACAAACFAGARQPFSVRVHPQSLLAILLVGLAAWGAGKALLGQALPAALVWAAAAIAATMIMFVILKAQPKQP
jgi:O-antigen/teichoic acid export membrane protein